MRSKKTIRVVLSILERWRWPSPADSGTFVMQFAVLGRRSLSSIMHSNLYLWSVVAARIAVLIMDAAVKPLSSGSAAATSHYAAYAISRCLPSAFCPRAICMGAWISDHFVHCKNCWWNFALVLVCSVGTLLMRIKVALYFDTESINLSWELRFGTKRSGLKWKREFKADTSDAKWRTQIWNSDIKLETEVRRMFYFQRSL